MNAYRSAVLVMVAVVTGAIPSFAGSAGEIHVTISGPVSVDRVWAVDLQNARHIEGKVTGAKTLMVTGLAPGSYCLVLKSGSQVIEGLRYPDEVYVGNDLSGDALQGFKDEVQAQETFFNNKTIWSIQGGTKKAVAFVFEERDKSWWDNQSGLEVKDTLVRRFDIQTMRKSGTAWLEDKPLFFLWREQVKRDVAKAMTHRYDDQLACIDVTAAKPSAKIAVKF